MYVVIGSREIMGGGLDIRLDKKMPRSSAKSTSQLRDLICMVVGRLIEKGMTYRPDLKPEITRPKM